MKIREIITTLDLLVCCGESKLDQEIEGGYAGDLLSDVIANSGPGDVWVTMQVHVNTVAVAVPEGIGCYCDCSGPRAGGRNITKSP